MINVYMSSPNTVMFCLQEYALENADLILQTKDPHSQTTIGQSSTTSFFDEAIVNYAYECACKSPCINSFCGPGEKTSICR